MSATFDALQARCRTVSKLERAGVRVLPLFGGFTNYDLEEWLEKLRDDWPHQTGRFELCYVASANTAAELLGLPPLDDYEGDDDMFVLPAEISAQAKLFDCEYTLLLWPDKTA